MGASGSSSIAAPIAAPSRAGRGWPARVPRIRCLSWPTPIRPRSATTASLNRAPTTVSCERAEHEGQQWISATHDGYRERFGLIYTRELFLAADGDDLRGEERLSGRPGADFAVRFHLHPSVQASLVDDETAALLRLPSGVRWRLRAAGAEMTLGESIYLGSGEARKTQQVVLSGTAAPGGTAVRWALRREPDDARLRLAGPGWAHLDLGDAVAAAAIVAATGLLSGLATRALIPVLRRQRYARSSERSLLARNPDAAGRRHRRHRARCCWLGSGVAAAGWVTPAVAAVSIAGGVAGGRLLDRRFARSFAADAARGAGRDGCDRAACSARERQRRRGNGWAPSPMSRHSACCGCGGSTFTTSWTASTASPAARRRRIGGGLLLLAAFGSGARPDRGIACRGDSRRGARLSRVELVAGADFSRRRRQRPARLSDRVSADRPRRRGPLEGGADPAALLPRRRDDHLGAAPAARRAGLAGASPALTTSRRSAAGSTMPPSSSGSSPPICC